MMNVTKGGTGFSDPRMRGQGQQDVVEEDADAFGSGKSATARGERGRSQSDEAIVGLRASKFHRSLKSALGHDERHEDRERTPADGASPILLASVGLGSSSAVPETKPTAASAVPAAVRDITRIVESHLRLEAVSSRAVSVHLHLPAATASALHGITLSLHKGVLNVVLLHGAADTPSLLPEIAASLADALGARLPQRPIRILTARDTGAKPQPANGLLALSHLLGGGSEEG